MLRRQRATCFESATLLCSLLLGADYNAYCVSGYAVREMCLLDQSQQECPLLAEEEGRVGERSDSWWTDVQVTVLNACLCLCVQSVISEQEPQDNKYTVRPPMELDSRFLAQQEKKKQEAEAALLLKQKLQEVTEHRGQRQSDIESSARHQTFRVFTISRASSDPPTTRCEDSGCTAGFWCCQGVGASRRTSSSTR